MKRHSVCNLLLQAGIYSRNLQFNGERDVHSDLSHTNSVELQRREEPPTKDRFSDPERFGITVMMGHL